MTKRDRKLLSQLFRKLRFASAKEDPLAIRQVFAEQVRCCSQGGTVAVVFGGMDCDGVEFGNRVRVVQAVPVVVNKEIEEAYEWADGPLSYRLEYPDRAVNLERWSVDRGMEAHEDGHPHVIYMGGR